MLKVGVALGRLNPAFHLEVALEAERLGFESVWLPEHLVFPTEMAGSPFAGAEHPPVPPTTPVFDALTYLGFLAGKTSRIRLGTHVYLLGLRHPFVAARAVQTLDIVSGGRAEVGVGAGWLETEFNAAGVDFRSRGRRLDEALLVCKRLWSEEVVEHHGEFFSFGPVCFEPKPVQRPWPPLLIGGESMPALRRAANGACGWIGLTHTPDSVRGPLGKIHEMRREFETEDVAFQATVGADLGEPGDWERWQDAGVYRVIVSPWSRSREAIESLQRFAEQWREVLN